MIVERTKDGNWLSNTCLVADRPGGHAKERQLFGGLDLELGDGDERVFTGDTLFRDSVGGTRAPGPTDPTTIGEEWERNPFILAWRGRNASRETRCTALGLPAALLLRARDYDGGSKCWVRFDEGNRLDVVPGSRVEIVEG